MSTFTMNVVCPDCGADVERVNGAASGNLTVAILACTGCPKQWEVTSRIVPHGASRSLESKARRRRVARAGGKR